MLLPTDRNAFSTKCGNAGWTTTAEADGALLSYGWVWEKGSCWQPVAVDKSRVDSDGGNVTILRHYDLQLNRSFKPPQVGNTLSTLEALKNPALVVQVTK